AQRRYTILHAGHEAVVADLRSRGEQTKGTYHQHGPGILEAPGHQPSRLTEENMDKQLDRCADAPVHTPRPPTTDIAPGPDHTTPGIGAPNIALARLAPFLYFPPNASSRSPNKSLLKPRVVKSKTTADAASI
ncbi:hypothetical protein B1218_37450, partial [Pseudomonas ogarae]